MRYTNTNSSFVEALREELIILKNEFKFVCEYPNNNKDSNEITLLSFGGSKYTRHTLMMKYVSVWSNDSDNVNTTKIKLGRIDDFYQIITKYRINANTEIIDFSMRSAIKNSKLTQNYEQLIKKIKSSTQKKKKFNLYFITISFAFHLLHHPNCLFKKITNEN
ncbi:hypothetical protein RFI_36281 [Reticulomyxa filosa]|uniref:Uncharacterized protein n=1 Tax=Reticulomyxa filosa TaxID=46433 RepID=X6LHR0_RETFI|nr:hypothetical protein RFI_36281 [Reticulomyxa filosa]|eukprot:ETO01159.1 hypothetical protein RFI_36281 [Reticulomyxa filosa]